MIFFFKKEFFKVIWKTFLGDCYAVTSYVLCLPFSLGAMCLFHEICLVPDI